MLVLVNKPDYIINKNRNILLKAVNAIKFSCLDNIFFYFA